MTGALAAVEVLAGLRDEVGTWGERATELQWADAKSILGDGPRRQWWGRTRGWSKTRDGAAVLTSALLAGMVPESTPAYIGASDADQAGLVLASIRSFVNGSGLSGRVEVRSDRAIVPGGGQVIVLPADSAGSFGLRPSWVLLDELCQWPEAQSAQTFHEALTSALPKVKGARLLILSTAGLQGHWSQPIYKRALTAKGWRVSEVHRPPPWMDPLEVEGERDRLPGSSFARFFENRWASGEERLTSVERVRACVGHVGPLQPVAGVRYVCGVDLGVRSDRTVAVVAHAEPRDGRLVVVVDRLERWVPPKGGEVDLGDVEAWLAEVHRSFRPQMSVDPWQALAMVQRLRAQGVTVAEFVFSAASVSRLALSLYEALKDQRLDLPDDEMLVDELATVRLVATAGGRYRLDHDAARHDDQAVAIGICVLALTERPLSAPGRLTGAQQRRAMSNPNVNRPRNHRTPVVPVDPRDPRWDGARALGVDPQQFFR